MSETISTREQMVATAARLFRRHGYNATSWRVLVDEAGTPWGSIQHHFPGGKEELGVEAIAYGAAQSRARFEESMDRAPNVARGLRNWCYDLAARVQEYGWEYGCPIATVALETVTTSPALVRASNEAFAQIQDALAERLRGAGLARAQARDLATFAFSAFEGALMLARVEHSTEPLQRVGRQLEVVVVHALDA